MTDEKRIIERLYGEGDEGAGIPEDADLRNEYLALSKVKAALDRRPKQRPERERVEAVLLAAETMSQGRSEKHKRIPRQLFELRPLAVWSGAIAAAIIVGFMAIWAIQSTNRPAADSVAEAVPAWDDADELRSIQMRIDALREEGVGLAWDEPAMPLESFPLEGRAVTPDRHQVGFQR